MSIHLTTAPGSGVDCSTGQVYIPDPTSCNRFYQCSNGTPYLFDCPSGLVFNPNMNVCDYPTSYNCDDPANPPEKDPYSCPKPDGAFPDPENCHSYYECADDVPSLEQCPGDMQFDAKVDICMPSKYATCDTDEDDGDGNELK